MLQVGVTTAIAYHDIIFATYNTHGVGGSIPCLEVLFRHVDYYLFGLASLDTDTLEATKGLFRTFLVGGVAQINLNYLITVTRAGISDVNCYFAVNV